MPELYWFAVKRGISAKDALQIGLVGLIFILVVFVIANVLGFATSRGQLPANTYLGDVNVSGLSAEQAISTAGAALRQPVMARYQTENIPIAPASAEFKLNDAVARAQLEQVIKQNAGWNNLPAFALRQITATRLSMPYLYNEQKLLAVLTGISLQYDHAPAPPQPDATGTGINAGAEGRVLNISAARDKLVTALASSITRTITLPVQSASAGAVGLASLKQAIQTQLKPLADSGNSAGVYVKDLQTGQELGLNADVAFSAKGWLRLGVALAGLADGRPEVSSAQFLREVLVSANETRLNELIKQIGNGDLTAGVQNINAVLKKLGLSSTFMAQPFGATGRVNAITTPGNSKTDVQTNPDPNMQSTPAEVGLALEMLNQCSKTGGPLRIAYPGKFTQTQCADALRALGDNKFGGLIETGSSQGATVYRRQSWDDANHGDAALVMNNSRAYLLVVILNSQNKLDWQTTAPLITNIARATAGYFDNGNVPPPAPALAAAPPQ